jgi:hypothetical protein
MGDLSGPGSINPRDKKMYEQEYKQSADLFEKALGQYAKSDNPYQKAEFNDVMDRALNILNETASELMRKELKSQNDKIAQDYATFQKFPDDPDTQEKLKHDLEKAKKLVG